MASITPINGRRGTRESPVTSLPPSPVNQIELSEVIDHHTRDLLERRPLARRRRLVPPLLVAADLTGLSLSYLIATLVSDGHGALGSARELVLFALSLPVWVLVADLHGLYRKDQERADHATTDDVVGVFHLVTVGVWLLVVVSDLVGSNGLAILNVAIFWLVAVCVIPLMRMVVRSACKRTAAYEQNTVIVGAGDIGQLIARKLIKHPEYGANVVGFVDRLPRVRRSDLPEHLTILGGPERLPEIIESLSIERVVIAFSGESVPELLTLLRQLRSLGVQIDLVPWLFELIGPRVSIHTVEGLTLLGLPPARYSRVALSVKRVIDVVGAAVGLVVLSPLMAYISIRIRLDSPGPVLFRQTRLGASMNEFTLFKFRTMKANTDSAAHREYISQTMSSAAAVNGNGLYKLDRADVVTSFGRWLRATSLDELPQLFNVLRGQMSLVGPRPCIPYEVDNFAAHHLERFLVPQGLTGLWQVTARAHSAYGEALDMDVDYARAWSLGLDLRLLLRTPFQVLRQRTSTS